MIHEGLTRHDLLGRQDDGSTHDGVAPDPRPVEPMSFRTAPPIHDPTLTDEPTGGAARPRRSFRSRLDGRTRFVLASTVLAVVLVNAGAAWAYWQITGAETGPANGGAAVELNLRGRSDLNLPLTPGSTGDLIVTVTNDNNFPLRITSVSPGSDKVVADVEHRENGCLDPGVVVAEKSVPVDWEVARNNVAAFTVPHGLAMAASSDPACVGATFTVPVRVRGVAEHS